MRGKVATKAQLLKVAQFLCIEPSHVAGHGVKLESSFEVNGGNIPTWYFGLQYGGFSVSGWTTKNKRTGVWRRSFHVVTGDPTAFVDLLIKLNLGVARDTVAGWRVRRAQQLAEQAARTDRPKTSAKSIPAESA